MYREFYKLKSKPFQITTDPKFLWLGEKHNEALATLRYGILDNRGFLLLTGEVGTGKTVLINRLVTMLDMDTIVATMPDPDLESIDFYNLLADGFKMGRTFDSKGAFLLHLRDFLHQSHAKQQQVLLVIDESQRLNQKLMEEIRVLSNIELYDRKLINIFFVGQREFNDVLMAPQNKALAQRITVKYNIDPLDQKETDQYIQHRLKVAGTAKTLFKSDAVKEVFKFSGGIPRLINIVCDHALLTGYSKGLKQVDAKIVSECADELRIPIKYDDDRLPENTVAAIKQDIFAELEKKASIEDGSAVAVKKSDPPQAKPSGQAAGKPVENQEKDRRPLPLTLAYIAVALLLVGAIAFSVAHFSKEDKPQWGVDDLTPQKYKTSLEKEKAELASRMGSNSLREDEQPAATQAAAEEEISGTSQSDPDSPSVSVETTGEAALNDSTAVSVSQSGEQEHSTDKVSSPLKDLASAIANSLSGKPIEPLPFLKEELQIRFTLNSNEITSQSIGDLERVAAYLVRHPGQKANVKGYTDASGPASYNESVSRFRAMTVKSYLMGKGVASERLNVMALGAADPIAPNDTSEGRRQNRRVEIELLKHQAAAP